jgi:quercetin dioxygenase-like cupin family protein
MRIRQTWPAALIVALFPIVNQPLAAQGDGVKVLMTRDLAAAPGKETIVLTVEYAPGAVESAHRHNAQAFVFVIEGSVVMQVKGGPEVTLKPGDTFYEGPADIHVVGRNASRTAKARFVVFLVKDKGAPVVIPVK